jgi:hypothetical protein
VKGKSTLPNASQFIVVQSSKEPNLDVGIVSTLNILDCAELIKAGTVSIPMLSSYPPPALTDHMIYWCIDFAHTIKDDSLKTIKLMAPNDEIASKLSSSMATIVNARN